MPFKSGDRVRVVTREVTEEDRKTSRYYPHMAGLSGMVQNVYDDQTVGVQVDLPTVNEVTRKVHATAAERMRSKITDEQKKLYTKEEAEFIPNYVLLVQESDLEKA
jgi:hypothetical protein